MTTQLVNPLDFFGVPKWFVGEELEKTPPGLENIRDLATAAYRRLARFYHPDSGTMPDVEKFKDISILAEQLTDLDAVEVWARYLLDTGSLYYDQARELAATADQTARDRTRALLGMLPAISPYSVLGTNSPMEAVFGLPMELHVGIQATYDQTFVLRVRPGEGQLYRVQHPYLDDIVMPLSFSEGMHYNKSVGQWVAPYMEEVDGVPEMRSWTHTHREPLVEARLIGGVRPEDLYPLAARMRTLMADEGLRAIGGTGGRSTGLSWVPARNAWWISVMRPEVNEGDFAVVLNPSPAEPLVALVGVLMATRPLSA